MARAESQSLCLYLNVPVPVSERTVAGNPCGVKWWQGDPPPFFNLDSTFYLVSRRKCAQIGALESYSIFFVKPDESPTKLWTVDYDAGVATTCARFERVLLRGGFAVFTGRKEGARV